MFHGNPQKTLFWPNFLQWPGTGAKKDVFLKNDCDYPQLRDTVSHGLWVVAYRQGIRRLVATYHKKNEVPFRRHSFYPQSFAHSPLAEGVHNNISLEVRPRVGGCRSLRSTNQYPLIFHKLLVKTSEFLWRNFISLFVFCFTIPITSAI